MKRWSYFFRFCLQTFAKKSEFWGGVILFAAAVLALVVANHPQGTWFSKIWDVSFPIQILNHPGPISIKTVVNDIGMTLFFLLVGMEIKREFTDGELSSIRKAAFPIVAAIGGMMVPAAIYLLFCHGTPFSKGFGIPIATDIAFATGVLALLGKKVPSWAKVFLTSLAIFDDIGSILFIAAFYTQSVLLYGFFCAAITIALLCLLQYRKVTNLWVYLLLGIPLWISFYASGIHATLSGIVLSFFIPQKHRLFLAFEHRLKTAVTFFVLPLFALCNASIKTDVASLSIALHHPITKGVFFGLFVGKPLGVLCFSFLAAKLGLAKQPQDARFSQMASLALLAGIGFTMSLFITQLSFHSKELQEMAKVGILLSSLFATILGIIFFLLSSKTSKSQLSL